MSDAAAETARLIKVAEAMIRELKRQSVAEMLANLGFNLMELARVVVRAADGEVIPFRRPLG
jgi:hypothetical protein